MFDSYFTSIWCVIITMTTVGYGDVFAVSPFGRVISIINALWGAFIISLLVGSIQGIFNLNDNQKKAIAEISNSNQAAASLRSFVKYCNARVDYLKHNGIPEENRVDYVPTKMEVKEFKSTMISEAAKLRDERKYNEELVPKDDGGVEKDLQIVKD